MSNLHNIGIAPFNNGSLNIEKSNSFCRILDEETFVAAYQQYNPSYTILALGKCVGGFDVGSPKLIYQEVVHGNSIFTSLIVKLAQNRFCVWFLYYSGKTKFVVYEIENNKFVKVSEQDFNREFTSTWSMYVSWGYTTFLGSTLTFETYKDNIAYFTYKSPYNKIFLGKVSFNTSTKETMVSEVELMDSSYFTQHNLVYDIFDGENTTYMTVGLASKTSSNENSEIIMRTFQSSLYTIDFGTSNDSTFSVNYIQDLPNRGSNTYVFGNNLYLANAYYNTLTKIDGFNMDSTKLGTLTSGENITISSFPSTTTSQIFVSPTKVHPNFYIIINDQSRLGYYNSGGRESTRHINLSVLGRNNEVFGITEGGFKTYDYSIYGCMSVYQRKIASFSNYFVIPTFKDNNIQLMVVKA